MTNILGDDVGSETNVVVHNEYVDYHVRETISNINELTELNTVLKGTLIVEDRTILQLSESVSNLEECSGSSSGSDDVYDEDSLEDIIVAGGEIGMSQFDAF